MKAELDFFRLHLQNNDWFCFQMLLRMGCMGRTGGWSTRIAAMLMWQSPSRLKPCPMMNTFFGLSFVRMVRQHDGRQFCVIRVP